jgi:hypothetical protein
MNTSHLTSVVAGLVFTLAGASSWAGPPNNDVSDEWGNTAGGTNALVHNTPCCDDRQGQFNTAWGDNALGSNTTGYFNTASGSEALKANATGSYNTASGRDALRANTIGANNTALGRGTLVAATAGTGNTAIGWGAGASLTSGSQNIYLGHPGVASESNTLRLGSSLQTRTFLAGVVGHAVTGTSVLINSAGQLGVLVSSPATNKTSNRWATRVRRCSSYAR